MAFQLDPDIAQERYYITEKAGTRKKEQGQRPPGRELEHIGRPYTEEMGEGTLEQRVRRLVLAYLREPSVAEFFGYQARELSGPDDDAASAEAAGEQRSGFRWLELRNVRRTPEGRPETVVAILQQTFRPEWYMPFEVDGRSVVPDVWGGGLRVVVHTNPLRITSASSTYVPDIDVRAITGDHDRREPTSFDQLRRYLAKRLRLPIKDVECYRPWQLFVYRMDPEDLRDVGAAAMGRSELEEGIDYLVQPAHIRVRTPRATPEETLVYRIFLSHPESILLYQRLLGTNIAMGQVFETDPVSAGGRFVCEERGIGTPLASHANEYCDCLDGLRVPRQLMRLKAVRGNARQSLRGEYAEVAQSNPLGIAPPTHAAPFEFSHSARSNEFAAVNAYYHIDRMVALVERMGFDLEAYFGEGQLPIKLVHRGQISPSPAQDGRIINAQVRADLSPNSRRVEEIRFALGDLNDAYENPLGIAADPRWIWHEFCHVLLQASTGEMEFRFCHSAGDALAAIMSDPSSALADGSEYPEDPIAKPDGPERGITFPFVYQPLRRHDRQARKGWGWFGALHPAEGTFGEVDPGGYRAEEIMSSTLFRLYRALGGDAEAGGRPDRPRRQEAAGRVAYLIVRAIRGLGEARAVPSVRPGVFATALMEADTGTERWDDLTPGGTLRKVIRWAFEQQGHYQPDAAAWPVNGPGAPPEVELVLDDGRDGGYDVRGTWETPARALWVRRVADGRPEDESPAPGRKNFVYVALANRGRTEAIDIAVEMHAASGGQCDTWERGAWKQLEASPKGSFPDRLPAGERRVYGPFEWPVDPKSGRVAVLFSVSARGDRSNLDPATELPCARCPVAVGRVVPYDNNLGYRSWS